MKSAKVISLISIGACLLFSGCMSTQMGNDFNSENISKIVIDRTTEGEVIALIGQPHSRMRNSDGTTVLQYIFSPGQTVTPFSGFNPNLTKNAGAGMKQLMVIIGPTGKVQNFTENNRSL